MAGRRMEIGLVAVVVVAVATLWAGAAAQSSSDCTNVFISMSPCLSYISGNSSIPSSNCCSQLASVVRSQPQCLCQVLNGGASSLGITINQTQAMALPGACNVQTPSVSLCNGASPAGSPTGTPSSTVPSGTGSNTVPSTEGNGSSDGTSLRLSVPLFFVLLYAASYGSNRSTY
ncbi:non-specific lipid-transfer protein-like protein At2g13820 [Punica granatum]|uniref:Non-specific lipid-transfer protein-like protein At2g13820 n=1 Tax=Punica granatum TaxID=22663 RepID=A0A218WWW4_PUNGR|nr:non-specific lipid-transfer protein-like protein At2g13820 [Punica granatum]OWM77058.1 hypothetical protein CDL15_Pgr002582 [Punica granatum]